MTVKKYLSVIILIIASLLLSGCWDYHELNNYSIISGFSVDMTDGDKYLVTLELVDLVSGSPDVMPKGFLISGEGETFKEAFQNTLKTLGKPVYNSHAETLVLSEKVVKKPILPIISYLIGDPKIRMDLELVIAKDKPAQKVMGEKTISNNLSTLEISMIIKSQKHKIPSVKLYQLANDLESEGVCPIIPIISIDRMDIEGNDKEEATVKTYGTAYLKNSVMAGTLNDGESQIYSLILSPRNNINVRLENGSPVISIDIEANQTDYSGDPVELKEKTEDLIRKMQGKNGCDIFGFGNLIYRRFPAQWDNLKSDWPGNFRDLKVNISLEIISLPDTQLIRPVTIDGKD